MPPLPKRRTSKAHKGKRRSHLQLVPHHLISCPQCHSPQLSHQVCPSCGYYKGREVLPTKKPKKKSGGA